MLINRPSTRSTLCFGRDGQASIRSELPPRSRNSTFNRALEAIWQALDAANKYIVATSPFTLAKDPANLPRVAQILANLVEGIASSPTRSNRSCR